LVDTPQLRMDLVFERNQELNKPKGSYSQQGERVLKGIMLLFMIGKFLMVFVIIGVMIMMLLTHMLCMPLVLLVFMVEVGLGEIMYLGKCAMNLLLFSMRAILLLFSHVRMQK
jgi:hypothetical protein